MSLICSTTKIRSSWMRYISPGLAYVLAVPSPKVQSRRLLAELLLQTSQLRPKDQVVIIAATNRMGELVRKDNAPSAVLALWPRLRSIDTTTVEHMFGVLRRACTAIAASQCPPHPFLSGFDRCCR